MRKLKITAPQKNTTLEEYLSERQNTNTGFTIEEENELVRKAQNGDSVALEELKKAFKNLVIAEAKDYQNKGLELSKLIELGNKGFLYSVEHFDEQKGFFFHSYMIWCVKGTITKALKEQ